MRMRSVLVCFTFLATACAIPVKDANIMVPSQLVQTLFPKVIEATMEKKPEAPNNHIFNKIFYINLESSKDRKANMESILSSTHISYERIPGITPEAARTTDFQHLFPENGRTLSGLDNPRNDEEIASRTACSDLAHRTAYEKVAKSKPGFYLILEDDVKPFVKPGWEDEVNTALNQAPSDWGMLRIGFWGKEQERDRVKGTTWMKAERTESDSTFREKFNRYYGAFGIVLDPEHAQQLLDVIKLSPLRAADDFTGHRDNWRKESMAWVNGISAQNMGVGPSYVMSPRLIEIDESIESDRRQKQKD